MYNQGHAQAQHGMLNGGNNHRNFMQMGMNKPYGHHQGQQHHVQHQQHQDHGGHQAHNAGFAHHHHNLSGGGGMSQNTPQFTPAHLQQNGTPNSLQHQANRGHNEHWALQVSKAEEAKAVSLPHPHARTHPSTNRSVMSITNGAQHRDGDKEDRNRNRAVAEVKDPDQVWTALDLGLTHIMAVSPALFNYTFLTKLYLNNNKLTYLPSSIGRLRQLVELDISVNVIGQFPVEIGMLVKLRELLAFHNDIQAIPHEMGSLYELEMLGMEGNPLRPEYLDMLKEEGTSGLIRALRENSEEPEPPEDRVSVDIITDETAEDDTISALSWNILCDRYCTQALYGYTPTGALEWTHRRERILQELNGRRPDIISLQECDEESFEEFFSPELAAHEYRGVFYPKMRAERMAGRERKTVDGCAIFFNRQKYIKLDQQRIDFTHLAINRPDMKGESDVFNRVMPRDHIAVVVFLENRMTGSRLIVVNGHIYWDPHYVDVKVIQVAIMLEQIAKLADKYARYPAEKNKEPFKFANGDSDDGEAAVVEVVKPAPSQHYDNGGDIPLIICGDFNSDPHSGIYKLLSEGSMAADHRDLTGRKYGIFTRDGITHPFSLKSAYSHIDELDFTNYTPGYSDVIDYIWYSTNTLQVRTLLGNVDRAYMQRVPGFPNWHFPSDHLALLSEFTVKARKDAKKVVEADFGPQRDRR